MKMMIICVTSLILVTLSYWVYQSVSDQPSLRKNDREHAASSTTSSLSANHISTHHRHHDTLRNVHSLPDSSHNDNTYTEDAQSQPPNKDIAQNLPPIEELYSPEELHDILFITSIIGKMNDGLPSFDELREFLLQYKFHPYTEREGHKRTGFRRIIRIEEKNQPKHIIKEFYSSYHEYQGELLFDRLYYGLEKKTHIFDHILLEIDRSVQGKYIRRSILDNYARWDFPDGTFVFIRGDFLLDNEEMVLIGKEYEIH
ncbi:MAG: hypothetical protein OXC44_03065 [Proteobacteria bacterium]|nr:hypothetical protein [Pseudomonadota bacterium]